MLIRGLGVERLPAVTFALDSNVNFFKAFLSNDNYDGRVNKRPGMEGGGNLT